jgi:transmembrane sensor
VNQTIPYTMSTNDQELLQTMQHIGNLFFRKLHNELSEQDKAVLDAWLGEQDPASKLYFEQMTDWQQVQTALQYMYHIDEKAALADVQKKIQLAESAIQAVPVRKMNRLPYAVAAAVVILAIGVTLVFTLAKKKTGIANQPVGVRFKNDVMPGSEKAILQLADGKTIVLDHANKGAIAREGNTNIVVDEKAGSLQYVTSANGSHQNETTYNTLSTPRGGQYRLVLPDGSKVWLNAASSIRYPIAFTGNERSVAIKGEAYFEVAKDPHKPFKVVIDPSPEGDGRAEVEVLGTHFTINAYDDEAAMRVTLLEGKIKFDSRQGTAKREPVMLQPGEQVIADGHSPMTIDHSPNIEEATAWKDGLFYFRNAGIETIMRQVSRWYNVKVQYEGTIKQEFIGKIPRTVNVSTLLKILESTGWVHFTIQGNVITVSS